MANNQIKIGVGFNVDKAGLNELQESLKQITIAAEAPGNKLNSNLQEASRTAQVISDALKKAYNADLGTTNISKFSQELKKNNLTIEQARIGLSKAGIQGSNAFYLLGSQILKTNVQLKESNKLLDSMATSMANTVKWGITSSIFNNISGSIQKAYGYAKNLDSSLNDIRIVTDKSAESMREFAKQANDAAKGLGASTLDYTEASLIYYQQGLSDEEAAARAETTIKAANVTGQTGQEVSEQLTAVWNGYKVTAEEAELYVDKLAAVAADTSADLEELSVGMSKVASAANLMGVDIDQLNAQLATIVSVTRQAPESVGTALKTIYARMGDIEAGLDSETTLGAYTEAMSEMGFNVLDMNGNLRDMGEVIEEIGGKWSTMSREQQISLSQTIAGTRQYNNLLALFDNWDMYTDALQTSADAAGTLQKQQDIYMESTAAHLKELKASMEGIYDNIFEPSELNVMIDGLTNLAETAEHVLESFGGGLSSFAGIGAIIANIFSKQIAGGINKAVINHQKLVDNAQLFREKAEQVSKRYGGKEDASATGLSVKAGYEEQAYYAERIQAVQKALSEEELQRLTTLQSESGELKTQLTYIEESMKARAKKAFDKGENDEEFKELISGNVDVSERKQKAKDDLEEYSIDFDSQKAVSEALLRDAENRIELSEKELKIVNDNLNKQKSAVAEVSKKHQYDEKIYKSLLQQKKALEENLSKAKEDKKVHKQIIEDGEKRLKQLAEQVELYDYAEKNLDEMYETQLKLDAVESDLNRNLEGAEKAANITDKIQQATSALSIFATGFSAITSTVSIWQDEQATSSEKILQTFMLWSAEIPLLVTSYKQLLGVLGLEQGLLSTTFGLYQGLNIAKNKNTTVTALNVQIQEIENKAIAEEAAIQGIAISQLDAESIKRAKKAGIQASNIGLTEAETAAVKKAAAAQNAWNASLLANPYILAGAAIIGTIAGIAIAYDALTLSAEEAQENVEKSIETYKNTKTELEQLNSELETTTQKIEELYKKAEEGTITVVEKEELAKLQALNVATEANIALKKKQLELDNKQATKDIQKAIKAGSYDTSKANQSISNISGLGVNKYNLLNTWGEKNNLKNDVTLTLDVNMLDVDTVSQLETDLQMLLERGANKDGYYNFGGYEWTEKNITNLLSKIEEERIGIQTGMQEIYDNAMQNLPILYESNINGSLDEDIKYLEEKVYEYYTIMGTVGSMSEAAVSAIFDNQDDLEKAYSALIPDEKTIDRDKFIDLLGEETFELLENTAQNLGISMYDLLATSQQYEVQIFETVEKVSKVFTQTEKNIEILTDSIEKLRKQTELTAEEISALESKYPELANIWNKNSQEYIEALELLREQQENIGIEEAAKQAEEAWGKAKESLEDYADTEEEETKLKNFSSKANSAYEAKQKMEERQVLEAEVAIDKEKLLTDLESAFEKTYELEVSITEDLLTDVDNIISAAENAATAVELIGDGFKVAAKDSEELFKIFPELAHNAEVLADGTIQLDDEVTTNILKNNGIEIDSDKAVTIKNIDNRIAELEAKKKSVAAKIEAVKNSSDIEQDLNKILGEDAAGWADYESKLSQATTDDEVHNSGLSAQAVIANWAAKEKAAMDYAKTAAEAEAPGHKVTQARVEGNDYGVQTEVVTQDTASNVEGPKEVSDEQVKANVEKYLRNLYDSYETQIADLTIGKSQLLGGIDGIEDAAKGSGSDRDKKELKDQGEEIDRYWELNKAIEMVTEALSDLDKQQENLYGRELIESLKQENELLEEQAAAYEALAEEQRKEAYELQGMLQAYGVVFDAQGGVANYLAASQTALDSYNQAVIQYNAGIIDEATFAAAERAYETFKALMERYEALYYEEWQETQNQLDDIHRQQLENNLKAWETELELKLDTAEAERDWNDFLAEINEDFKSHYRDISAEIETLLKNAGTYVADDGTIEADIQAMRDIMAEIDKMKNGGESDMFSSISEAQEKLKELIEQMQDDATALYDLYKSVWEAFMEGIDQSAEKFEDLIEQFERIDGELEYQGQLIELLYGEEAYGMLDKLYKAQEKNTLAQVDSLKQQKDMWYELWQNAEEGSEEQAKYYELWTQAQDDLNSKVIEYIELLQTDYLNTVDDILSKLDKDLTGGMGMEKLKEQWEDAKEEAEKYLNETEEVYAIQSLYNKYSESISNASSLKSQQKLQALREEELQMLREKDKLTQYDIDRAEAKYQIALKEMALEDARNAKDSMKLTRGTDGNWSYQYVADEDDIANKEQELLDAQNNLYEIDMEEQMNKIDEYIEKLSEFQEEKEELYRQLYATTDEIERQRILDDIARLEEEYYPQLEELAVGFEEVNQNLAASSAGVMLTALTQNKDNFASLTEEQRLLMEGLVTSGVEDYADLESKVKLNYDGIGLKAEEALSSISTSWGTGAQALIDAWNADDGESVKAQMEEAHRAIMEAADEYQRKIEEVAEVVEEDWSEDGITGAIGEAEDATEDLEDATGDLVDETVDLLDEYADALEEVEEMWEEVKDAIEDATAAAREYMSLTGNGSSSGNEGPGYNPITPPNTPGTGGGGSGNGGGSGSGSKNYTYTVGFVKGEETWHKFGLDWSGVEFEKQANDYENEGSYIKNEVTGKVKAITTKSAFDTGGYTGDWAGGEGKMAILHSKELVLNAADTKNILKVVDTVRDLSNLSSSIEDVIMRNISSMLAKMMNIGTTNANYTTNTTNNEQKTENIFHINAEFPNANDVNDIKEALLSLPNLASQYLMENKK